MAKQIPLSSGKFALVDDEDYEWLSHRKWSFSGAYATRSLGVVLMHRLIAEAAGLSPDGLHVDHIDGNKLNNCRSNLRVVTRSQNMCNRSRKGRAGKSGYVGVSYKNDRPDGSCWRAVIGVNGKEIYLGGFRDPREAARAYDAAARKYHGEFATLNFPDEAR